MNSPATIEKRLYWQRHILAASKDPKQLERALRAIEKLKAELAQAQQR